jgi:hypothetical protein
VSFPQFTSDSDGLGIRPAYARYEFATPLLRDVDDVEFLLDAGERVIHVRSASRVGHADLGANRNRIERIREQFSAAGISADKREWYASLRRDPAFGRNRR